MKKWPLRMINYLTGTLILSSLHCMVVAIVSGGDVKTVLHSMIYLPIIIMLSESQKRTKHFWQFAIFAVVAIAVVRFSYSGLFEQILGTVLAVGAVLMYFYTRAIKTEWTKIECPLETPVYQSLVLFLIMYFMGYQYSSEMLKNYAVLGAGFYCLLCMYKINFDEIFQIIDINGKLERFPEKRLFQSNLVMMGFQTIIVACGMGIFLSIRVDWAYEKIISIVRRFLEWLLHLLEAAAQNVDSEACDDTNFMLIIEAKEQNILVELLLQILEILSVILVIALILYFVYCILKTIYQLYLQFDMNSAENGDEIERIDVTQTKEKTTKRKKTEKLFWDWSPNARIRKYYKKRVLRDLKEAPQASMTPEEIERNVEMDEEKKKVFHRLYEQARYGNEECSKEDVGILK